MGETEFKGERRRGRETGRVGVGYREKEREREREREMDFNVSNIQYLHTLKRSIIIHAYGAASSISTVELCMMFTAS